MNNDNTFGKRLQKLRKSRGLTQEQLAELADIHEKHVSKLELGTYKPNIETLKKILKALGLTIEEAGFDLEKVSANDNPFYVKSMQILNSATEQEIGLYYGLLKQGQKCIEVYKI